MSENKQHSETDVVIRNKSQGSVATHFRCGKIFTVRIISNLLLSLQVKRQLRVDYFARFVRPPSCWNMKNLPDTLSSL